MIIPMRTLAVASAGEMSRLDAFADLARSRCELTRLYSLIPTPSLATRLAAVDHVLVRQYEHMIALGQGLEAAAVLGLYRSRHVRMAAERRERRAA